MFIALSARAVMIHLFPSASKNLEIMGNKQYRRNFELSPYRGTILDRRGEPLAISIRRPSIFINPKVFTPTNKQKNSLSKILKISRRKIALISNKNSYFQWVKRKVTHEQARKSIDLNINGLHTIMEPARFYPQGEAISTLIGKVGIDNQGLMGLESFYEQKLKGQTIKVTKERDARGKSIFLESTAAAPEKTGNNITLSIDRVLQEITYQELRIGIIEAGAKSGFAIVSDPHSGKILALANYPSFNPNNPMRSSNEQTRNFALLDLFEPGSVTKPFLISEALEKRVIDQKETLDCEQGILRANNWKIRDSHPVGETDIKGILVESSNICSWKIAERLGSKNLYNGYKNFGIGTGEFMIGFPGQMKGRISNWKSWKQIRYANISFGQGFLVNAVEVVQAMGAIANGGNLMKPWIRDKITSSDGSILDKNSSTVLRRVMSPEHSAFLRKSLAAVVEQGTGSKARMINYSSAGKTGTSEKIDPIAKAYSTDLRVASFAGFVPAIDPHLVIYVVVDEPSKKPYYGGQWAAPIFRNISLQSMSYMNVSPDKTTPSGPKPSIARGLLSKPSKEKN